MEFTTCSCPHPQCTHDGKRGFDAHLVRCGGRSRHASTVVSPVEGHVCGSTWKGIVRRRVSLTKTPNIPTVCLDVISLVASSCGYDSGQIAQRVVYLPTADKYRGLTRRPSKDQKGLDERTLLASQRPFHPW